MLELYINSLFAILFTGKRGTMSSEIYKETCGILQSYGFWKQGILECDHITTPDEAPCDDINDCKYSCDNIECCILPESEDDTCFACSLETIPLEIKIEPNYESYIDRITVGNKVFLRNHPYPMHPKITKDERKFNEQMWELWANSLGGELCL